MGVIWLLSSHLSPFDVTLLFSHLSLCVIYVCKSTVYDWKILPYLTGNVFMKMSSNHPVPFLIGSWQYWSVVIVVLHMCLVFCVNSLSVLSLCRIFHCGPSCWPLWWLYASKVHHRHTVWLLYTLWEKKASLCIIVLNKFTLMGFGGLVLRTVIINIYGLPIHLG